MWRDESSSGVCLLANRHSPPKRLNLQKIGEGNFDKALGQADSEILRGRSCRTRNAFRAAPCAVNNLLKNGADKENPSCQGQKICPDAGYVK